MALTQIIITAGILGLFALFGSALLLMVRGRRKDVQAAEEARRVSEARATSLEQTITQLVGAQSEIKGQVSALSEVHVNAQARTMKVLEERFDGISGKMNVSLSESAEKNTKSLSELATRLEVIDRAQKNITELSGQVVGLQNLLDNKQKRGAFGETQMEDIFKNVLPPNAYEFQAKLSNGKQPDALIKMPNPPGSIVVDSKFPLESYRALRNAADEPAEKEAKRAFKQAIKTHINNIAERYIVPGETAESALMFLPSEAVYAELHANFEDLVEESYKARVWIVSPTTLMATLNTVRAVLKDVAMQEQAHLIQIEVANMMDDVSRLDERVVKLNTHFQQTQKDIGLIQTSTGKISRRGEKIREIEVESPQVNSVQEALGSPEATE